MKIKWFVTGMILFMLFSPAQARCEQKKMILDSDSAKLFEGFGQYVVTPVQAEKLPGTGQIAEGAAVFKIIQVQNIAGNNPFNPIQPVFNFGGVLLSNVDDLISCIRGGVCQSGGGGGQTMICSPSSAVSAGPDESVTTYVRDPTCRVEQSPGVIDPYEFMFALYDNSITISAVVGTDKDSGYNMITPPSPSARVVWPSGTAVYKITDGTYTAVIQHKTTLVKYSVNFTLANLAGKKVRLTVNSLSPIP